MAKLHFTPEDLTAGCMTLKENKRFSPGFDKMTVPAAEIWLKINGERLCDQLNGGKYHVMPALGFSVAKKDGKYRRLVRLTAIDSIIQIAALDKLSSFCAERFSEFSYAYQKGKGVGNALDQFCKYALDCPFAAKIDPSACFDNVDHAILERELSKFFYYRKTVNLLSSFIKMPVIVDGELTDRKKGILQGAPISGMLCNVFFNSLDEELSARNIRFLRYADDIVVFAKTLDEAKKYYAFVSSFLEKRLRLQINRSKSIVDKAEDLTYLGHTFIRDREGVLQIGSNEKISTVFYEWNGARPINQRSSVDILSTGILRQKDYAALFESDTEKHSLPTETLDRINIFSSVVFDSRFLEKMMRSGICVNVFSKNYDFLGRFVPSSPLKDQRLIFEQISTYNDAASRLELAKEFDLASVHNIRLNIRYYNKQHGSDVYEKALKTLDNLFKKMKACDGYENLLMTEAQARAAYYSCFDSFIQNDSFSFIARSRRPPLNEMNALISFGNVVLYNYIATEIYKSSLDIRIGFLHAANRREESLNLDIAEIFKPLIVDRTVFTLINRKELTSADFNYEENGGVYLNEEGKRKFLRGFYDKLNSTLKINEKSYSYAMLIDEEIRKLTRRFRKGEKYKAFRQVR